MITVTRANEPGDRHRLILRVGDRTINITREEARLLRNQLQRFRLDAGKDRP